MQSFKMDVIEGLGKSNKTLPSKYFYDLNGDRLFQEIMNLQEYYLPRLEMEIIKKQSQAIYNALDLENESLDIVELGSGDGFKTRLLLKDFYKYNPKIAYYPLDISSNILVENVRNIRSSLPKLKIKTVEGNYIETLPDLKKISDKRLIILLGSNIGNYTFDESLMFIEFLKANIEPEDFLLIAFDKVKHPRIILNAYDDSKGITKEFNLNLLHRINIELGANFELSKFDQYSMYNPSDTTVYSYIISLEEQCVEIEGNYSFHFKKYENIHTEVSKKYSDEEIEIIAVSTNLQLVQNFSDYSKYYSLVLFKRDL